MAVGRWSGGRRYRGVVAPLEGTLARRWALRMLLLALIAVGVAAMHTIGHGGMDAGASAVASGGHSAGVHASATAPMRACHGMCPDPFTVCLFVVTTTGLLLVIAMAASVLRGTTDRPGDVGIWRRPIAGRAPPPRWPIGLQLAELSVLRT